MASSQTDSSLTDENAVTQSSESLIPIKDEHFFGHSSSLHDEIDDTGIEREDTVDDNDVRDEPGGVDEGDPRTDMTLDLDSITTHGTIESMMVVDSLSFNSGVKDDDDSAVTQAEPETKAFSSFASNSTTNSSDLSSRLSSPGNQSSSAYWWKRAKKEGCPWFTCKNGRCVIDTWTCDLQDDCGDFSDEEDCESRTCPPDMYRCRSGMCINPKWLCDNYRDCPHGDDEESCPNIMDKKRIF